MTDMLLSAAVVANGLGSPADIWASIIRDFSNIGEPGVLTAFVQVLLIDLVLAGDNAIVRHIFSNETESGGKAASARVGILQVWQKKDGAWKLLARQAFRLPS